MQLSFRNRHIIFILKNFDIAKKPLDSFLRNYFRKNKSIGSKDRKFIAESIYEIIRYKGILDYLSESPITWEKRLNTYQNINFHSLY